jgi:hypothetical protein
MPDIRSLSERLSTGLLFILMVPPHLDTRVEVEVEASSNQPFRAKLGSFHHSHTHMGCVPHLLYRGVTINLGPSIR